MSQKGTVCDRRHGIANSHDLTDILLSGRCNLRAVLASSALSGHHYLTEALTNRLFADQMQLTLFGENNQ